MKSHFFSALSKVKIILFAGCFLYPFIINSQPLRVGVAGLNHDHVFGLLNEYKKGAVIIIGIAEADTGLVSKFRKNYNLPESLFYKSTADMLEHIHPDAVMAFNAIADHLSVVEACATKKIPVMVEKPLATTVEQADRIAALARQYGIPVLTNYETTWYSSNQQLYELVTRDKTAGSIRKMVVHMGHQGPKEIGCSPDFLKWLTDPVKNGGGAVIDFGCYGANLMTWLMDGKPPVAVLALTRQLKPSIYPDVDDDATILLEYPGATGIIEASWNWPYGIKDLEVYGEKSYFHSLNSNALQRRDTVAYRDIPVKQAAFTSSLAYLAAVLRGQVDPGHDLSSLDNNIIVVRILAAARASAKSGKKVVL